MLSLVDMHCHLLAGLDDGPRTWDESLQMCRLMAADGGQMAAATAHQNPRWPGVTPDRIREAVVHLRQLLLDARLPLTVFPCAEVMAHPDMVATWQRGELLSIADHRHFLLVEMPHGVHADLRQIVEAFRAERIRLVLAHAERQPDWLHDAGLIEGLIQAGCLVQVSASSITDPANRADEKAVKDWFLRGCVHLLGSDAHSPTRRPPGMSRAYEQIRRWAGVGTADRVCLGNALAVLQGIPLAPPPPTARRWLWFLPH